jgi:hypothetical protein
MSTYRSDLFKPVLLKDVVAGNHRVEYRIIPELTRTPDSIDLPNWLVEQILYVWDLEYQIGKSADMVKAIKLVREVKGNLGLKESKDVVDSIHEVHLRCKGLAA